MVRGKKSSVWARSYKKRCHFWLWQDETWPTSNVPNEKNHIWRGQAEPGKQAQRDPWSATIRILKQKTNKLWKNQSVSMTTSISRLTFGPVDKYVHRRREHSQTERPNLHYGSQGRRHLNSKTEEKQSGEKINRFQCKHLLVHLPRSTNMSIV